MSKDVLAKSKLNNNKNINKKIDIHDITLKDVTIDDLELGKNNYNQFINLKNLLDGISSCQLSDAYNNLFRKTGVVKGLKSINNLKAYGRIATAKTNSDDWGTGIVAIHGCENREILFIESSNTDLAIWGELASTDAKNNGVSGVAIYGSVRDMEAILFLDFPIFASDFTPNAGKPLALGTINENLIIEGEIIRPGDFFLGDKTGVVVIPASLFVQVINEVLMIKLSELGITEQLDEGKSLMEITGLINPADLE
ncbi:MAG: RraA family protein [Methanobrevibacter sp.]|uniref:RraA family protein n=1 Tax=Methanobrevibacter sp. TaxID=66852 RepID=UPI0026DFEE2E|nr:RraA family protein [Methanobrevibacter sp.]MDO5848897.1 RraA family protein [Methanobrevibacter sp.]